MRRLVALALAFGLSAALACGSDEKEGKQAPNDDEATPIVRLDACKLLPTAEVVTLLEDEGLAVGVTSDHATCYFRGGSEARFLDVIVLDGATASEAQAAFAANLKEASVAPGAKGVQPVSELGDEAYSLLVVDSTGYIVTEVAFRSETAAVVLRAGKLAGGALTAPLTEIAKRVAGRIATAPAKTAEPTLAPQTPFPPQTPTAKAK